VIQSLGAPANENLMELLIMIDALKGLQPEELI
jgi:phosphoribosylpyrophosphate synthetase